MGFTDYTYNNPAGINSVIVECWGAGASGNNGGVPSFYGGGGGGAYSRKTVPVTPLTGYLARVGDGGIVLFDGGDTTFFADGGVNCVAKGGLVAGGNPGGLGGQAAAGDGDIKFSGGDGGDGDAISTQGAGGGSSASRFSNGGKGGNAAAGGAGGTVAGGGPGGDGGPPGGPAPAVPSGPGGGGGTGGSPFQAGAAGFRGLIVIWRVTDFGPSGLPLAHFAPGDPVPAFPKDRKRAYIM